MASAPAGFDERLNDFLGWFKALEPKDQAELMDLVRNEYKVRDVVRSFSGMPVEQRKAVFQRLGLPNDLLTRIPPPSANGGGDVEVEWQEWDGARSA